MKNKQKVFFILFFSILFFISACSSKEHTDQSAPMDMASEEFVNEDDAGIENTENADLDLGDKIIKTASLTYETVQFDETVNFVHEQMDEFQAQIEHSSRTTNSSFGGEDGESIQMTIRLPKEQLEPFIERLNNYDPLYVQSQEIGRSDVTKAFRDNETRINVLKEEEDALRDMLQEQGSLEEILQIRTRLSEVISEREIYEEENQNYQEQIEFSTIYLNIQQTDRASDRDVSGFWDRLVNAFGDSFYRFIQVMQQLFINLVYLLPYLVILLIVGAIAYFIRRRIRH
ncbi:MAG TPA: DUF4349 domain-containing protein [Candidatus Atopostipes pullistercoris]|uniref:DUF4349 domain-containing protein n=1 Tax=Candidatus Atopostipes pullistercoris TaxID=2838467 RepID=A0A9D2G1B8_9LACT|nr:DUF4349 domain-containing protein [Candidatus Atopostipes pullistercoris]